MHRSIRRGGHAGNGTDRFRMIRPEHIGHGDGPDIGLAPYGDRQEVIILIHALRRRRGLQLQGDRFADGMVIIRDPEIPGMLSFLVFNAPVPPAVKWEGLFCRSPAVFRQPGAVCRRLMLRKEVFPGIMIVPADNGHRVVRCAKVPRVMCPAAAEIFRRSRFR